MENQTNTETKTVLVLAGPSGCGKSTLARILLHEYERFAFSVSATTRHIRMGETHGKDYYFLTIEEFQKKIIDQEFIEYQEVFPGKFYGSLKSEALRIGDIKKKMLYDLDVHGALKIKEYFGEKAHIVFIKAEDRATLEQRLRDQGAENEDGMRIRINRFDEEFALEDQFDDSIINVTDDLDAAKKQLREIILDHFTEETRVPVAEGDDEIKEIEING